MVQAKKKKAYVCARVCTHTYMAREEGTDETAAPQEKIWEKGTQGLSYMLFFELFWKPAVISKLKALKTSGSSFSRTIPALFGPRDDGHEEHGRPGVTLCCITETLHPASCNRHEKAPYGIPRKTNFRMI